MTQHRSQFASRIVVIVTLLLCPALCLAGPKHDEDIIVGRNAVGQLVVEVNSPDPIDLPHVKAFLHGWAANEPGFKTLDADESDDGFFMLGVGSVIRLEIVFIDPGLKVWSPGFAVALSLPGQSFLLGGADFDTHATFHIDSTDPAYEEDWPVFSATLRVVDTGMPGYAASTPFAISFSPVPEPASLFLLCAGALGIGRLPRRSSLEQGRLP